MGNTEKNLFSILLGSSLLYILYKVKKILLPFILGFIIAYCFKDLIKKYENKYKRSYLSIFLIVVFSIVVIVSFIFVLPKIFSQFISLFSDIITNIQNFDANRFYTKLNKIMEILNIHDTKDIQKYISNVASVLLKWTANITNKLIASSFQMANIIFMICVSPVVAFYFLRDWELMSDNIKKYIVPDEYKNKYITLTERIDNVLHHYIIGQIYVCLIFVAYYFALLSILKFKYSFVVGIISGFAIAIPYVGSFGVGMLATIIGYFQFGFHPEKFIAIILIYCVGQFLEGNFVTPNIMGNKMQIHPLWLLFSVFVGGSFMGIWGIILSVPLTGMIGVVVRFYLEEKGN